MKAMDLAKMISSDNRLNNHFIGIFPIDLIPSQVDVNDFFIINSSPSDKEGTHWLVLYKNSQTSYEFFDSFGYSPNFYKLYNFANFLKDYKFCYQNKQIQSVYSIKCGLYCLFYASLKVSGHSMVNIIEKFSTNCIHNDKILIRMLY